MKLKISQNTGDLNPFFLILGIGVIPLVAIGFNLLLIYFCTSANMSQRELEEIRPPYTYKAMADEHPFRGRVTIISIYHLPEHGLEVVKCEAYSQNEDCPDEAHWRVAIRGRDLKGAELTQAIILEGDYNRDQAGISNIAVIIRADKTTPYWLLKEVLESLKQAKIRKIGFATLIRIKENRKYELIYEYR